MTPDELINIATDYYLHQRDFNGYPSHQIHAEHNISYDTIRNLFMRIVSTGRGTIVFGDRHRNPHIRAFDDEPLENQIKKLESAPLEHACLYPSAKHLVTVVNGADFLDRPFTRELAFGAGQLEFRSFDLSVLEIYRNDPRYHYENDDIRGRIVVKDEFCKSDKMHEKDQIILEAFGFSYDDQMNRAVAVFPIYLSRLTPEHQQIWNSKRLTGKWQLHPDYYRNSILGDWGTGISIFDAFSEELKIVNAMCRVMGRPSLFLSIFEEDRPRNFSFLVRPTQEEFNAFALTLDKMMSDNISKKFFLGEVAAETEEARSDGKIGVRPKGTIAMLEEWFPKKVKLEDPTSMQDMFATFRRVRKLRQTPAHVLRPDVFDQKFFREQRELIESAYKGIRTIRLIFEGHPQVRAADINISELLHEGKIWSQ